MRGLPPARRGEAVYSVYAIRSTGANRIYIGHSNNIEKRLKEHNAEYVKSTSNDGPWKVVAVQNTETRNEARWIESRLKRSRGGRVKWLGEHSVEEIQITEESMA